MGHPMDIPRPEGRVDDQSSRGERRKLGGALLEPWRNYKDWHSVCGKANNLQVARMYSPSRGKVDVNWLTD